MDDHGPDQDRGSDAVTIVVIVAGLLFMIYEVYHPLSHPSACQRVLKLNLLYCLYLTCSQYLRIAGRNILKVKYLMRTS